MLVVLGLGLFGLAIVATVAVGTMAELRKNRNTTSGDQMFYTAHSAADEGVYQFLKSAPTIPPSGLAEILNGASSAGTQIEALAWPYYRIRGNSANPATQRHAVRIITVFSEGEAFKYALFADADLTIGGSAQVNGNIFSNNDIIFPLGCKAQVVGDAFAAGDIEKKCTKKDLVTGDEKTGLDQIPPIILSSDPYKVRAQDNGTYFNNVAAAKAYLNSPSAGDVVFVDDPATLKLTGTDLDGTLVTMGSLELAGNSSFATTTEVSIFVNGDLDLTGNVDLTGIIYVTGVTTFGNGTYNISGSLISLGGITVSGNTQVNFNPAVFVKWPGMPGLPSTSGSPPLPLEWGEE